MSKTLLNGLVAAFYTFTWSLIGLILSTVFWPVRAKLIANDGSLLEDMSQFTAVDIGVLFAVLRIGSRGSRTYKEPEPIIDGLIQLICRLSEASPRREQLTRLCIGVLRNMSHTFDPSLSFDNNVSQRFDVLGVGSRGDLPDPELIFDLLMARDIRQCDHPGQVSSVFFYLAAILAEDLHPQVSQSTLCSEEHPADKI
jgi:hypothetical protein